MAIAPSKPLEMLCGQNDIECPTVMNNKERNVTLVWKVIDIYTSKKFLESSVGFLLNLDKLTFVLKESREKHVEWHSNCNKNLHEIREQREE